MLSFVLLFGSQSKELKHGVRGTFLRRVHVLKLCVLQGFDSPGI